MPSTLPPPTNIRLTVWDFLDFPLPVIEHISPTHDSTSVPRYRRDKTATWSAVHLKNVFLMPDPEDWKRQLLPEFKQKMMKLNAADFPHIGDNFSENATYAKSPTKQLKTEGDVVCAAFAQVVFPIVNTAREDGGQEKPRWFGNDSKDGFLYTTVLHEWFEGVSKQGKESGGGTGVKADAVIAHYAKPGKEQRAQMEEIIKGMQREAAKVAQAQENNSPQGRTRSATQTTQEAQELQESTATTYTYLPYDHSNLYCSMDGDVKGAVYKPIFVVEYKKQGYVQATRFHTLAPATATVNERLRVPSGRDLAANFSTQHAIKQTFTDEEDKSGIAGTCSMLRQAVRYGHVYQAPFVCLTDLEEAIVIDVSAFNDMLKQRLAAPTDSSIWTKPAYLPWYSAKRDDIKKLIALLLHNAGMNIQEKFHSTFEAHVKKYTEAGRKAAGKAKAQEVFEEEGARKGNKKDSKAK